MGDREVRASFLTSYRVQAEHERRAFRLLGLLHVEDFGPWVLAALLNCDIGTAEQLMESLVDARLLEDSGRDVIGLPRYRFHDLLRLFARERLKEEASIGDQRAARERGLRAYLDLGACADRRLDPDGLRYDVEPLPGWGGVDPSTVEAVRSKPLAWFEVEWLNLIALLKKAAEAQLHRLVLALASRMTRFFSIRTHWQDWEDAMELCRSAAKELGDPFAEALVTYSLGVRNHELGDFGRALKDLHQAKVAFEKLDNARAKAHALTALAVVHGNQRNWRVAIPAAEQAVPVFNKYGMPHAEAYAHLTLSVLYRYRNHWNTAMEQAQSSLKLYEETHDQLGVAGVLRCMGDIYRDQGAFDEALQMFQRALDGFEYFGDGNGQSRALRGLGIVYRELNQFPKADEYFRRGLQIAQTSGDQTTVALILVSSGVLRLRERRWEEAQNCFDRALPVFYEFGDPHEEADVLYSIGVLLSDQGQPVKALEKFELALSTFEKCDSALWIARTLAARARDLKTIGDEAGSADAWRRATAIAHDLNIPESQIMFRGPG